MKVLRCRDAGFDCCQVIYARHEAEILNHAAGHVQTWHHVQVTADMMKQIRSLIRDDTPIRETNVTS